VAMLIAWCEAALKGCATTDTVADDRSAGTTTDTVADDRSAGLQACHVGWAFALACLTRYEAWPVTASALMAAAWTRWRRGQPLSSATCDVAAIALYPAIAVAGFTIFSRVVIGEWFVGGGFFVPENKALDSPLVAAAEIGWGARMLSGGPLVWAGA